MDMVLCIALMGGYIYGDIKDYFGGLIGEHGGGGMINGISFNGGMGDGHHNSYSQQYHLTRHRGYKFQLMYFVFFSCKYYTYRISFQELVNTATNILGGLIRYVVLQEIY